MKTKRLLAIMTIIENHKIGSQEELLKRLAAEGFELTQATLSRDLKYLKVAKVSDGEGGYIYIIPEKIQQKETVTKTPEIHGFLSLEFFNNMGVIKTIPGYANSVASVIDDLNLYEILGTVSGNDTILVIPREGVSAKDIKQVLALKLPVIKDKI